MLKVITYNDPFLYLRAFKNNLFVLVGSGTVQNWVFLQAILLSAACVVQPRPCVRGSLKVWFPFLTCLSSEAFVAQFVPLGARSPSRAVGQWAAEPHALWGRTRRKRFCLGKRTVCDLWGAVVVCNGFSFFSFLDTSGVRALPWKRSCSTDSLPAPDRR